VNPRRRRLSCRGSSAVNHGVEMIGTRSKPDQPDSDWGPTAKESRSALQSAVSSYSTGTQPPHPRSDVRLLVTSSPHRPLIVSHKGPVAPSDRIKYSDAALIKRACTDSGALLRPSKPATAIDSTFLYRSELTSDGPDGEVWSSFTELFFGRYNVSESRLLSAFDMFR